MNPKKRLASLFTVGGLLLIAPAQAAVLTLPPANVFSTSFESTGTPAYTTGNLSGQNGWGTGGGITASAQVVTGGSGNLMVPDGSQMLKLANLPTYGSGPIASLAFTGQTLTDKLYFSALTAFSGTVAVDTLISRLYLNNSADEFDGAIFGIRRTGGENRFFFQNNGTVTSFGAALAQTDTFYRFDVALDITTDSFSVSVFDEATNTLQASTTAGKFRNNDPASINYLRLQNNSADGSFVSYFDQIWISTNPIPEASSLSFLLVAGFFLIGPKCRPFFAKKEVI